VQPLVKSRGVEILELLEMAGPGSPDFKQNLERMRSLCRHSLSTISSTLSKQVSVAHHIVLPREASLAQASSMLLPQVLETTLLIRALGFPWAGSFCVGQISIEIPCSWFLMDPLLFINRVTQLSKGDCFVAMKQMIQKALTTWRTVVQSSKDSATGVLVCCALHAPPSEILALYLKAPEAESNAQQHHQVPQICRRASIPSDDHWKDPWCWLLTRWTWTKSDFWVLSAYVWTPACCLLVLAHRQCVEHCTWQRWITQAKVLLVCQQWKPAKYFPPISCLSFQVGKAQLRIPATLQFVDMELLQKESACLALLLGNMASGDGGGSMTLLPVESLAFSHIPPPASRLHEVESIYVRSQTLKIKDEWFGCNIHVSGQYQSLPQPVVEHLSDSKPACWTLRTSGWTQAKRECGN